MMPATETAQTHVRPAVEADLNFVFATWLRNYKQSHFARRVSDSVFFIYHHRVIQRIVERGAKVFVATPAGDGHTILGYLVLETLSNNRNAVHFVYVKRAFRGLGVMRDLFKAAGLSPGDCIFTHWTKETDTLTKRWPTAVYIPYLV